jgi:hypothetical protein
MGLRRLYEKKEQWDKLAKLLEVLVQTAYEEYAWYPLQAFTAPYLLLMPT